MRMCFLGTQRRIIYTACLNCCDEKIRILVLSGTNVSYDVILIFLIAMILIKSTFYWLAITATHVQSYFFLKFTGENVTNK